MAKLDFAASKIQSTTNMIKSGDTVSWDTDALYPSSKAVVAKITEMTAGASGNAEFPVGSIIIMGPDPANPYSTNDPSSKLGGKWTLVDKTFKTATSTMGSDPSTPTSTAASGFSIQEEVVIRNDHSLLLQLKINVNSSNTVTLTPGQPIHLATLTVNNYGLTGGSSGSNLSLPIINATAFASSPSTTASSIIRYSIATDRRVLLNDIVTGDVATRRLEAGSSIYINVTIPVPYTDMKNDFCDKFYWQRTE